MTPRAWLHEIGSGSRIVKSHAIEKMVCSLGTDKHSDIRLTGRGVAPVHAQITTSTDGVTIEAVAGERMVIDGKRKDSHELSQGDVVSLGGVRLRFERRIHRSEAQPDGDAATPLPMTTTLDALSTFSEALSESYDIDELLETMLDSIIKVTDSSRGVVMLLVEGKPQTKAAREAGEKAAGGPMPISDSIVQKVLRTRQPEMVSDALNDTEFQMSRSVIAYKLCSVLCVPLMVRGELLGVIYLGNDNVVNLFTKQALQVASVFASQASMVLRNAILIRELRLTNESLTQQIERMNFGSLIGSSPSMREIFRKIDKVAKTDVSVLVDGETGTGKELVAAEVHRRSQRADGPFVVINCGAIPENLLESELFGHVRGAFTGAVATRDGKFQQAHGGSLFLDEIGEMPLNLQVKLLRVLEDRRVTRIGEGTARDIDIRIIAATNRNLAEEAAQGIFREDLYYRLNVVRLNLAPLRERGGDVELLARYFLKKYADDMGVAVSGFTDDATRAMRMHRWPGNIRELENRIKKAVIFCDQGVVDAEDLDLGELNADRIIPLNEAKEIYALEYVGRILDLNGGNRTQTAKDLDVDVRTVFRYLEKTRT